MEYGIAVAEYQGTRQLFCPAKNIFGFGVPDFFL